MSARDDILGRIGDALRVAVPREAVPRAYRRSTSRDVDPVGLFAERVADYRATVHRCAPGALAPTIAQALAARGAQRIAVPSGLDVAWLAESAVVQVADVPLLSHAELDGLDGIVTACAVAIAETGTIVLDARPRPGATCPLAPARLSPLHRPLRADRRRCPRGAATARSATPPHLDQRPIRNE